MVRVVAINQLVFIYECMYFLQFCTKKIVDRDDKLTIVNIRKSLSETLHPIAISKVKLHLVKKYQPQCVL